MRMINSKYWLLCSLLPCCAALAQSESHAEADCPFTFNASYTGDLVSNFAGGIKQGTMYLGLANIKGHFDTQKAGLWRNGEAFVNVGNTHGGTPTQDLVGDFQGVSNIEAGNLTFMYELWYRQTMGPLSVTLGLQDLNTDFAVSEYGAMFTNSSFGIHSSIADNIASPIFPLTALGVNASWDVNKDIRWECAVFDGTPDEFESNPYNVHWKLSKDQGFLAVTEWQLKKSLLKNRSGVYKLGFYYHQHFDSLSAEKCNRGMYVVADQELTSKLSVFSQIGISPKKINRNNHYFSLGLNVKGLLKARPDDQCGVAVAHAEIGGSGVGSETALELVYKMQVNKYMYLKPDLQYIMNPAGTDKKLDNALVGMVRVGIEF